MISTLEIKKTIEDAIPLSAVFVKDPHQDGQHFEAIVVSPSFEGMLLVKQHQMVMKVLKAAFNESLHALSLKTFTPEKWDEVKHQYNF